MMTVKQVQTGTGIGIFTGFDELCSSKIEGKALKTLGLSRAHLGCQTWPIHIGCGLPP